MCCFLQVLGHTKTVVVLLGGWAFLGDHISLQQFGGMLTAVAGMVLYGFATCAPQRLGWPEFCVASPCCVHALECMIHTPTTSLPLVSAEAAEAPGDRSEQVRSWTAAAAAVPSSLGPTLGQLCG